MNKKLIAMAVAAGMMAPMAASHAGVKVYGQLQAEIASVTNDGYGENNTGNSRYPGTAGGESAIKMNDNKRGRLGFKVSEDLGSGLNALAKFEWQVDTVHGNIADGSREGWVGLKGGFGQIEVGRIKSPYKYTGGVKYDPFVTTYMEARKSGGMLAGAWGQNSFWNTSLAYKNHFGNVSLWVNLGVDQGDGTSNYVSGTPGTPRLGGSADAPGKQGDYAVALKYKQKSWEAFVVTEKNDTADSTGNDWTATKVGGQVKFGPHKLSAQYETISDSTLSTNQDTAIYFVGYQMKLGQNILVAQIGSTDADNNANDTDYYALGAIHKFSKKTRAFVGYRSSNQTDAPPVENDLSVFSVGMRVDF